MVSKNNKILHLRKSATKVSKYKIKKLSVGVASVLVGATFFLGSTTSASASDEQLADKQAGVTQQTDQNATNTNDRVLKFDNATSTATTDNADSSAAKMSNVAQVDNSANNATVANNLDKKSITDSTLSNNNDLKSTEMQSTVADQAAADDANTADQTATEKQATVTNQATVDNTVNTADQATQAAAEKTTTPASTAANTQAAAPVVTLRAAATADTSTTTTVNNWTGLINALNNPYYQTITVDGTINAMGTGTVEGNDRTVVIKGADQNASIDFGSTPLNVNGTMQLAFENLILKTASANGAVTFNNSSNTSTVTFKDVTHSGASLYGGSGNAAVVIDGTTTSTVSTSSKPTAKTYSANGNGANIWGAKSVTVADGANFTLNRSAIGDGINLPDGATVQVGDNATMTVNLNTDNGTESARYHDAGIFMLNGGNFLTGRNAVVNMNTSIGQAVSIGADRPGIGVTAADRFGGYGTSQSRNAGPTAVTFGDYSQFNFTGRDGFILGNNANFTSGEYSNVHFQNQGRGVALDLANNSNIVISKHSNTLFESNGKTGTSGSYDGYNYIGVNEGGNITVDEYATFRVILTGRGDNPWDDVISLDSRNSSTNAAFTSKKGAIVDIRDDNTNFYAELISFPLGAANSVIDIQDPLYLNLQRYSADGATKGWMPVGGTDINSTSAAYTANLIYMGGTKGVLKIGGTNYVVYQQIKSDGAQQIWLNVDAVEFNKNGFAAKDEYNNGANPDVSISGKELTANILANDIKDNQTSPTAKGAKGTAPYYGISTMRASHQIWFPHGTEIQAAGQHQNTIKYVYEDGTEAAPTVTQSVDMTRDITLDLTADQIATVEAYAATHTADETLNYIKNLYVVSQDSGWQVAEGINTKTAYDAVATPEIAGYTASIKSTNANGVTVGDDAATVHAILDIPAGTVVSNGKLSETYLNNGGTVVMPANYETVVVYQKEIQNQPVTIIYQDKSENNKVLATDELEGKPGTALDYSTADKIQSFIDKGYKLVSDGVPNNATFGDEPETYYVTLEHDIAPVGPNNPHEPGTPVNPNDPDGPKWPTQDQYTKDYTSTVEFVDDQGNKMPGLDDDVQTSTWTRTLNVDKVTGDVLNPAEPWTPDKPTYDKVNVPVVPGYYADQPEVPAKPTVQENITDKVVYKPMGKIVPVDPSGNPIPDAPTPQYPNDPTDPTKTTPDQPVPEIPGMTPQTPVVTPENPGKDTPVVYEMNKHSLTERFVDEAGNELEAPVVVGTDYVKNDKYNVTGDAKMIDGYYLTAVPSNAEGTFGDDNVTVTFTYAKLGKIIPVDPSGNPIPDAPTPQYPNDPTDPTKTTPDQPVPTIPGMTPEVPSVTPENPGQDTPVVYEMNKHSLTERFVDEAGNELAPSEVVGKDYVKDQKYNVTGDAKVIEGYYLTAVPSNAEGTFGDDNVTVTFTYAKLGKIIPVDPSGNPIPDAPTPQYPNDPTDPTKTTPNQPVPSIPGMNPEVPAVTPNQPGQDTPVTYVPVVPEKQLQTAKIVYVDTKTGKTLETDTVTGKSGEKIDYSTTPRIDEWRDKGYRLVEDGFAEAGTPVYDDNDDVEQIFIVKLDHDTAPVGPNDPHEPGTPINPNDPNGPKWPAKDSYTKQYTSTVHFVDENGNKLHDDNVQTSTWTRTLIVDKATGEILNPDEAWHSDIDKYSDVKVDPIKGYYTDRKSVPGEVAQQQDIVNTVVYKQIGKIVPVDPSGNPIPDAPTPQYPNDPTDPTKTTPNQPVPEIPGMIPEVPSVTPENPGEDTPIVYNKVETPTPKTVDVTPETPKTVDVTSETPKATPVKTAPQVEKVKAPELPQTGEKQNNALTAVGASIMTGLLGILAFAKKKKDDKEI